MTRHPHLSRLASLLAILLVPAAAACSAGAPHSSARPPEDARSSGREALGLVTRALKDLGGPGALARAGGLHLVGEGTYDVGVRMQGLRPGEPAAVPVHEVLAVDPRNDRVSYEYRHPANLDAGEEWIRFVYSGEDLMEFLHRGLGFSFARRDPEVATERRRHERMIPHLLLSAARDAAETLRMGALRGGGLRSVHFATGAGEAITLIFDIGEQEGGEAGGARTRLAGFEYLLDVPFLGDTLVRWEYLDPREIAGLGPYPSGYRILLNGEPFKEIRYTTIAAGEPPGDLFGYPEGIEAPDIPEKAASGGSGGGPLPRVLEVDEGISLVANIRSGFHILVVEREDHLVVIDAPSGWWELHQVPAANFTGEESSHAVSERLLGIIAREISGKPIRYVVLTHFHSDHAGGIRSFIARGAAVVGTETTLGAVRAMLQRPFTLSPDPLKGFEGEPAMMAVSGRESLPGPGRAVEVIEVGKNPHVEGMVVVHLPGEGILYQSDLFFPSGEGSPLDTSRLPIMKFFVAWLDGQDLAPERIYSIHGSARVRDEQLEEVRELARQAEN